VTHDTLQSALEALYGLERRKDKLGLDGTRTLLAALGNPERRFRSVHVAGTNGKGSAAALIERALREAGHRTGLFTSPHLVDFRERIRVNGRWADEQRLFETLERIEALPAGTNRTFFEVATALGFLWFAEQGVEWAVVEVGLGGRLDTTNVIAPDVCVITSIGLDHTEILGATIAAIAREKAGIAKPGVPVVVGALDPEAAAAIAETAARAGAPLVRAPEPAADGAPFARLNSGVARAALEALRARGVAIPERTIESGFALARWPGRFERCPGEPRLWWDGAHNPDGARALAGVARGVAPFGALVLALSRDKDAGAMLDALAPLAESRALIATRSRNARAMPAGDLAAAARARGWSVRESDDVAAACRAALALPSDRPVLLAGSLFAVGEAMAVFGGAPGEQQ
jgi:dihydrofolate synthase/folylpolyglutamate synthase